MRTLRVNNQPWPLHIRRMPWRPEPRRQAVAGSRLKNGANPNQPDILKTALFAANEDILKLFKQYKADMSTVSFDDAHPEGVLRRSDEQNKYGKDTKKWNEKNVSLALKYGFVAPTYFKDIKKITEWALIHENFPLLNALIKDGNIDVNNPNLLLSVVRWDNRENVISGPLDKSNLETIVETLIKAKTDVNAVDRDGNTPLMIAAKLYYKGNEDHYYWAKSQLAILKLLAKAPNIDTTIRNKQGKSAFDLLQGKLTQDEIKKIIK